MSKQEGSSRSDICLSLTKWFLVLTLNGQYLEKPLYPSTSGSNGKVIHNNLVGGGRGGYNYHLK